MRRAQPASGHGSSIGFPVAGELDAERTGRPPCTPRSAPTPARRSAAPAARAEGFEALLERRRQRRRAARRLRSAAGVDDLYRRSLLVLETPTDRRPARRSPPSNAIRASPTRAGTASLQAVPATASSRCLRGGRAEQAAAGLRCSPASRRRTGCGSSGWVDGALAPAGARTSWTRTGIALFAYEAAWRELADETLERELWPPARAAGSFLARVVDERGLLLPSIDLWEQDDAQRTPTPRPLLSEASVRGRPCGSATVPELADEWLAAAATIAAAIDELLWSEADGHYVRARLVARNDEHGEPVPRQFVGRPAFPARTVLSVDPLDRGSTAACSASPGRSRPSTLRPRG